MNSSDLCILYKIDQNPKTDNVKILKFIDYIRGKLSFEIVDKKLDINDMDYFCSLGFDLSYRVLKGDEIMLIDAKRPTLSEYEKLTGFSLEPEVYFYDKRLRFPKFHEDYYYNEVIKYLAVILTQYPEYEHFYVSNLFFNKLKETSIQDAFNSFCIKLPLSLMTDFQTYIQESKKYILESNNLTEFKDQLNGATHMFAKKYLPILKDKVLITKESVDNVFCKILGC